MDQEGKKFDGEKTRYELLPPYAIEQMAKVLTNGAKTYGDRNWEAGIKFSRILGAIKRHTAAIERGEDYDTGPGGDGLLHSAHLLCEAGFLTEFYKIRPEFDDREIPCMKYKRIGLDIDDVLADFIGSYCVRYNMQRPKSWCFDREFKSRYAELCEDPYFWQSIPPLCSADSLPFEPSCYITSRGCPKEWTDEWLFANGFPAVPVIYSGLGCSKVDAAKNNNLDMFVDDCFDNFIELNNAGIFTRLFTATHNERYSVGHYRLDYLSNIFM